MEQNNRTTWIIAVIILGLLVVGGFLLFSQPEVEQVEERQNGETQATEDFESVSGDEFNAIVVEAQLPGEVVFYRNLTLEEDGFVIVRSEENGTPSEVIGSAFHEAGENMSGNVELNEPTVEGGLYFVELYTDSNENGAFDVDEDENVTTASGDVIRVRIEATQDLPEQKG